MMHRQKQAMKKEGNLGPSSRVLGLMRALMISFVAVALALLFWSVLRAPTILARGDNPRLVEEALRIQRGRILDRRGVVLAETVGPPERVERNYPIANIGPAVGYYSFLHGTSGAEEGFDAVLRGDGAADVWANAWRAALHLPQQGQDVTLTLDAALQQTADHLLGARTGAALLLEIPHGVPDVALIRALASHPGYNPNLLDEQFDALVADAGGPLLNRATQGQYQPGLLLQPLIIAQAVETGIIALDDTVAYANRPVPVNGMLTYCATEPPEPTTWADVLRHQCPGPMQALAEQVNSGVLPGIYEEFGLTRDPALALATETTPDERLANLSQALIGQDNLSVTPLQIALATAALVGDGVLPQPVLAANAVETASAAPTLVSVDTAQAVVRALPADGRIHENNLRVLSGPEGSTNVWYVGVLPGATADYVATVVVEESKEVAAAAEIGRGLLHAAGDILKE